MPASPVHSGCIRNPALRLGILLGIGFSGVGLAWLVAANRVSYLDRFAFQRNLALAVAFALLALVPTCRFMKSPVRSFLSGITAWAILAATYYGAELRFPGLAARLSAFHLFVLGGMVFGLLSALAWVMNLLVGHRQMRQHPVMAAPSGLPAAVTPVVTRTI